MWANVDFIHLCTRRHSSSKLPTEWAQLTVFIELGNSEERGVWRLDQMSSIRVLQGGQQVLLPHSGHPPRHLTVTSQEQRLNDANSFFRAVVLIHVSVYNTRLSESANINLKKIHNKTTQLHSGDKYPANATGYDMICCMVFWFLCLTNIQSTNLFSYRCQVRCMCVYTYMLSALHCDETLVITAVDQQQWTADFSPLVKNILQLKLLQFNYV